LIGAFEVDEKDILGRIGRLETKSGVLETPHLFPVVTPLHQLVPPRVLKEEMGFAGIMTNAYLLRKNLKAEDPVPEVHHFLGYDRIIATDSGAYQLLVYGGVDVRPVEIVQFQEQINTDIAIILDVPTGYVSDRRLAKKSVDQTLANAKISLQAITRSDILWVGPIQGGCHLDLLTYSARKISRHPFPMMALGSPTQILEKYLYEQLVDMMLVTKMNTPLGKPIHLFGAGHPSMLALAVACGYDTFDSAAYALYAYNDRYMTPQGTLKLEDIRYFPCSCRACVNMSPSEVRRLPSPDRASFLGEHNLWTCRNEIQTIKEAVTEGRLWELVAVRAHAHPSLYRAFKKLADYRGFLSKHSPLYKRRGILYLSSDDCPRPEITHYLERLERNYVKPKKAETLVLIPRPYKRLKDLRMLQEDPKNHVCSYGVPFGIVPLELEAVYPLSQTEIADERDPVSLELATEAILKYVSGESYKRVLAVIPEDGPWRDLAKALSALSKKKRYKLKVVQGRRIRA